MNKKQLHPLKNYTRVLFGRVMERLGRLPYLTLREKKSSVCALDYPIRQVGKVFRVSHRNYEDCISFDF